MRHSVRERGTYDPHRDGSSSAALVILVEHEFAVPLSESLAGDEGVIIQQALTDRLVADLLAEDGGGGIDSRAHDQLE
jgi:hypothetical protein